MAKTYTINTVEELFTKEGYKLLSTKYINVNIKLDYTCPSNHTHNISLRKWLLGQRCPYCAGNARHSIKDVKASFEKEGYTLLTSFYKNLSTRLTFKCPEGHKHETTFRNWLKGNRCPYCSGKIKKTLQDINQVFAQEDYELLSQEYRNCETKLLYRCPKGHERYTTWSVWKKGFRCPECSGTAKLDIADIKESIEKCGYKLRDEQYKNNHEKLTLICPNNHTYKVSYANWRSKGYRCPKCSLVGVSKAEQEVSSFISSIYTGNIITGDRTIIGPKELDIVIPELNLAIEYCGIYWHSELCGKDRNYHVDKLDKCRDKGYTLLTIFEDEWILLNTLVKSRLASYINTVHMSKLYARQCTVREVSAKQARIFCKDNHLQGYGAGSTVKLGAFYDKELVAIMTFSKPSLAKGSKTYTEGVWELHRFCSKCNYHVVGVASKLLKFFERNYKWLELFSYADRRWSKGNLYEQLGFTFSHCTLPNYWYFKGSNVNRTNRFSLRKGAVANDDLTISEWQNRQFQGYNRIWDCGNLKYKKVYNNGLY